MAAQVKECNRCGAKPLLWKNLGTAAAPRWRLYHPDAAGNPWIEHKCNVTPPQIAAQASPAQTVSAAAPTAQTATAAPQTVQAQASPTPGATMSAEEIEAVTAQAQAPAPKPPTDSARVKAGKAKASEAYKAVRSGGGAVPALDPDHIVDRQMFDAVLRVIKVCEATGRPQNMGLHGPAGSGKTTFGAQIAAIRKGPFFVFEMASAQTADEVYGSQSIEDGTLKFNPSELVKGLTTEGATVLINDVALLQSRTAQNGLNEILDPSTRSTFVPGYGEVVVAPRVIIVGTWNVGAEYTGASELSEQILDRFRAGALIEVPYPSGSVMADILQARTGIDRANAERLARAADWLRGDSDPIEVSVRGLIAAATHLIHGATVGQAIAYTVLGDRDAGERARAFGILAVKIGNTNDNTPKGREMWAAPQAGTMVRLGDVA